MKNLLKHDSSLPGGHNYFVVASQTKDGRDPVRPNGQGSRIFDVGEDIWYGMVTCSTSKL